MLIILTKEKKPKILNFIKFLQNGHKESALREKRAKKNVVVTECRIGFQNHKTL